MFKPTDNSSEFHPDQYAQEALRGSQHLAEADALACAKAQIQRNVVSYSLFGAEPGYCECAVLNALQMPQVYPGWEMWLYHDDSVPPDVLKRLDSLGVKLQDARRWDITHWPGTFWRFAAVTHPQVRHVLFRDADSIVGERERQLVAEWLASEQPFHVIRDWYSHVDLILAGLWGAYAPFLGQMRAWVDSYIDRHTLHPTHGDQEFLAAVIWPRIRPYVRVHDSVHEGPGITPFTPADTGNKGQDALGGYRVKRIEVALPEPHTLNYQMRIVVRNSGQAVCTYQRQLARGQDSFMLPYEYFEKIDTQEWELKLDLPAT
jgi:hypothetical protein